MVVWEMRDLVPHGQESAEFVLRLDGREAWRGTFSRSAPHPSVVRIELDDPLPATGAIDVEVAVEADDDTTTHRASVPAGDPGFLEITAAPGGLRVRRVPALAGYR